MWEIKHTEEGWEWACVQSAYGARMGTSPTKAGAKIELAIAEAELFEAPYPPEVAKAMREDPERFAADFPDPA